MCITNETLQIFTKYFARTSTFVSYVKFYFRFFCFFFRNWQCSVLGRLCFKARNCNYCIHKFGWNGSKFSTTFYRAALNVGRSSRDNGVRSSVRPSLCQYVCPSNGCIVTKRKRNLSRFFIPYKILFCLVFWEKEWLVGRPLLREILDQPDSVGAKSPILNRYSLVAPQP